MSRAAFLTKKLDTMYGTAKLDIWDTAGQQRYSELASLYYRNAAVIVIVYDVLDAVFKFITQVSHFFRNLSPLQRLGWMK